MCVRALFHADTRHFRVFRAGRLLHDYCMSVFSWSLAAISSIMQLAYHIQVGWFQFSLPPPAISNTPISICIGNRKSYFAQDWISSQILFLYTDFSANDFQTFHLQGFYLKAISCPAITHCLWCVRAMCMWGAVHCRHFRLGSWPELRFINFIQISDTIK